jgi:hypothetical protein
MKRIAIIVLAAGMVITLGIIASTNHRAKSPARAGSSTSSNQFLSRESWTFVGYATPEATMQSAYCAENKGDWNAYLDCMTPELRDAAEKHVAGRSDTVNSSNMQREAAQVAAFQIDSNEMVSADECVLHIRSPKLGRGKVTLKRIENEWKLASGVTADK